MIETQLEYDFKKTSNIIQIRLKHNQNTTLPYFRTLDNNATTKRQRSQTLINDILRALQIKDSQ